MGSNKYRHIVAPALIFHMLGISTSDCFSFREETESEHKRFVLNLSPPTLRYLGTGSAKK